jgi:hypothetical protein
VASSPKGSVNYALAKDAVDSGSGSLSKPGRMLFRSSSCKIPIYLRPYITYYVSCLRVTLPVGYLIPLLV